MIKVNEMHYIPEAMYFYCRREGSITISPLTENHMTHIIAITRIIEVLEPVSSSLASQMRLRYTRTVINLMWRAFRSGEQAKKFIPELRRKAKRHAFLFLVSNRIGIKKKILLVLVLISPKLAYKLTRKKPDRKKEKTGYGI